MTGSALVTGATGPIGRAIVHAFAAAGYRVGIGYRSDEAGALGLVEAVEAGGGQAVALGGDLTDEGAARSVLDTFLEAYGTIDVLVNNAGKSGERLYPFVGPDEWRAMLAANLDVVHHLTRAVVRAMVAARSGSIVNVSSLSALTGVPGQVAYATAKAGLLGFTRALAREIGRHGVRVNAVAPGAVASPAVSRLSADRVGQIEGATCLGRIGTPDEIASVILFLASPAAAYVTGQVLAVDGGISS